MSSRQKPQKALSRIARDLRPLAVPIKSLKEDPENPRLHDRRNLDAIKALLTRHGQQRTILVSRDGFVVAGNGVLRAAMELGWMHLAVVRSSRKLAELRELAIGDNRSAELSEWDEAVLAGQLAELEAGGLKVDELGFSPEEMEKLSASLEDLQGETDETDLPDAPTKQKRADALFTLGCHRFFVPRKKYEAWVEEIKQKAGFDDRSVIAEIRRRLRL